MTILWSYQVIMAAAIFATIVFLYAHRRHLRWLGRAAVTCGVIALLLVVTRGVLGGTPADEARQALLHAHDRDVLQAMAGTGQYLAQRHPQKRVLVIAHDSPNREAQLAALADGFNAALSVAAVAQPPLANTPAQWRAGFAALMNEHPDCAVIVSLVPWPEGLSPIGADGVPRTVVVMTPRAEPYQAEIAAGRMVALVPGDQHRLVDRRTLQ